MELSREPEPLEKSFKNSRARFSPDLFWTAGKPAEAVTVLKHEQYLSPSTTPLPPSEIPDIPSVNQNSSVPLVC